uniref:Putative ovule protein n=1 Tax=Solanum chacoense TaxID=4108 RepID=A0A0V0H491_SOLCH
MSACIQWLYISVYSSVSQPFSCIICSRLPCISASKYCILFSTYNSTFWNVYQGILLYISMYTVHLGLFQDL